MPPIRSKVQKYMLIKEKEKKKCCNFVYVSVCLSAGSSVAPLAWLVAGSCLRVTAIIIIIIIIITQVGKPSRTIDLPRILSHLQLEISG